jgi:DNA-binding NarL/FixJ family response regulator
VSSLSGDDKLTERKQEIVDYVWQGDANREIAHTFSLSIRTAKAHLGRIFRKLNRSNRSKLLTPDAPAKKRQ